MADTRKICVVSGTRADYGLLFWLMKEIEADPALTLQLIVTGTHLDEKFGHTVDVIDADGFGIDARVPLDLADDSPRGVVAAGAAALAGIGDALARLTPDIVVVLGDRYEILAAATAALLHRIPIAHIHGGEITEGAIDDSMRHAVTKMASWHFAAAEPYRQRIIQMGEQPARVFTVGAPGLDHIDKTPLLNDAEITAVLGIAPHQPYFLVTHHPATLGDDAPGKEIDALLTALDAFPDHACIFTGVNADAGHDRISRAIHGYVAKSGDRARLFASLGQQRYLSAMKHARAVIGNSSSGIIEAPALGVPTVNIGIRQKGRLRAASVIDCDAVAADIEKAIARVLDPAFRETPGGTPPYGLPGASARMKDILAECRLDDARRKVFYDIAAMKAAS